MTTTTTGRSINESTYRYCFLDLNVNNHRGKFATAAAFVHATDSRYGFSSKDLLQLGGSELSRIKDLISMDHEWSMKNKECGGIEVRPVPPSCPSSNSNRIVVQLFWNVAPLACENFATLCSNGGGSPAASSSNPKQQRPVPMGQSGKPLTYRQSKIHRVIPGFILQGGDFVMGNGSGGESIYGGKKFKDEKAGLQLQHNVRGLLSMGNSGKNSNTSQFFITFDATPQCDGKHVLFGKVVSGFEVLDYVERFGTAQGEPSVDIIITDCGIYTPLETPGAGYWFDKPNDQAYSGISPAFMVIPRAAVVAPNLAVAERFEKAMKPHVVITVVSVSDSSNVPSSSTTKRIDDLLSSFAVDLVVVAPACNHVGASIRLPPSWDGIPIDQVVLEAKPVNALATMWTRSWLTKRCHFPLDGNHYR